IQIDTWDDINPCFGSGAFTVCSSTTGHITSLLTKNGDAKVAVNSKTHITYFLGEEVVGTEELTHRLNVVVKDGELHVIRTYDERAAMLALHEGDTLVVRGVVSSFPTLRYGRQTFELNTYVNGAPMVLRIRARSFTIDYGESLLVRGPLTRVAGRLPGEASVYLMSLGAAGEVRAVGSAEELGGHGGNPIIRGFFWPLHDRIRQQLARGFGAASGLPLALLLGERSALQTNVREAFKSLGITHLLALSGFHLGLVVAAVLGFQRLLGRSSPTTLIVVLGAFVGTVGSIVSLTRALIMVVLMVAARLARRPMSGLNSLAGAYVLILLWRPYVIYGLSFQLSFVATFAVLHCVARMPSSDGRSRARRVAKMVSASLGISCAAQLFVAPIILEVFGQISLMSPVATLVCVPAVAVVLMGSALAAMLSLVHADAGIWACGLLDPLCRLFADTVVAVAAMCPQLLELSPPNAGVYYAGLACAWVGRGGWWVRAIGVVVMIFSFAEPVDDVFGFLDF
ncbi:MAG: ComEC/Rec2 family competence protein, partial [bacterium]|nr:ComEC/Rec2 family competence protein [bacterium]